MKYELVWNIWGAPNKGNSHLLADTSPWGSIGYSLLRLEARQRLKKSHLVDLEAKELMICDCWEIGAKPLSFTQYPLGLKPMGMGIKPYFIHFWREIRSKTPMLLWGGTLCTRLQAKTHCCWGKGRREDPLPLKEVQKTILGPRLLHQRLGRSLL